MKNFFYQFFLIVLCPLLFSEKNDLLFSKSICYMQQSNYVKSWEIISQIKNPNVNEKALKAMLLYKGSGIERNEEDAIKIFKDIIPQLRQKQDGFSLYILGFVYFYGVGVNQNSNESIYYYKKSCSQLYLPSISKYYQIQKDFSNNIDENIIIFLYQKCIKNENSLAMYELAKIYENEKKDTKEAFQLYTKAANLDCYLAMKALGDIYFKNEITHKIGLDWYEKASMNGEHNSTLNLANIYIQGNLVEKNVAKGLSYYKRAAEQGNIESLFLLGEIYFQGTFVKKDLYKAELYYLEAVKLGHIGAMYKLLEFHKSLPGVIKYNEIEKLFKKISKLKGCVSSPSIYITPGCKEIIEANRLYKNNLFKEAISLYEVASEKDNGDASYRLGVMFYCGLGTLQSDSDAFKWFLKAKQQNNYFCIDSLAYMYKKGKFIEKNNRMSLELRQEAYKKNFRYSFEYNDILYITGQNDFIDTKTISILEEKVERWDRHALWNLAEIYDIKYGSLKDREIKSLLKKAIFLGSEHAIILLYDYLHKNE